MFNAINKVDHSNENEDYEEGYVEEKDGKGNNTLFNSSAKDQNPR